MDGSLHVTVFIQFWSSAKNRLIYTLTRFAFGKLFKELFLRIQSVWGIMKSQFPVDEAVKFMHPAATLFLTQQQL